jgi:outer membrane lipoprotein-sorting protein
VNENKLGNGNHLEGNVERLLSTATPIVTMPDPVKQKILARLTESEKPVRSTWISRRWLLAAAAVLTLMVVGLWPGGSRSGVSWADVVEHIKEVTTFKARLDAEATIVGSPMQHYRSIIYEKDPGLYRSETFRKNGEIEWVTVLRRTEREAEQLLFVHSTRSVHRTIHEMRGNTDDRLPGRDRVAEAWRRLTEIASSDAHRIGVRSIGGRQTIGFEIPAGEFFVERSPSVRSGTIRLWADRVTAAPLRLEFDFFDIDGQRTNAVLTEIEWDVDLDDELFALSVPMGWAVETSRRQVISYEHAVLARGITLRLRPETGDDLLNAFDIEAILRVESVENLSNESPTMYVMTLKLEPSAWRRIENYRSVNPHSMVIVDFNSELRVVPSFEGAGLMRVDLSRLVKSLEQLEQDYVVDHHREPDESPTDAS